MNPSLLQPQPLLMLLGMVGLASIMGSLTYIAARFLENKNLLLNILAAIALTLFTLFLCLIVLIGAFVEGVQYVAMFAGLVVCSVIGGWLHRASGGQSPRLLDSFLLMCLVAETTYLVSAVGMILSKFVTPFFAPFEDGTFDTTYSADSGLIFMMVCFTAPMVMVIFWRLMQMLKLRPGTDRTFNSGEDVDEPQVRPTR
jgi:hypothetical protein